MTQPTRRGPRAQAGGAHPPIPADAYKALFAHVAAPVAVVTAAREDRPHGTTVSSFGALSLDPPLMQVSLHRDSELLRLVLESGRFAVNVLAHDQEAIASSFARKGPEKARGTNWGEWHSVPTLPGCHGWLIATLDSVIEAGDHAIVLGAVIDAEVRAARPLIHYRRRFHSLPDDAAEPGPNAR